MPAPAQHAAPPQNSRSVSPQCVCTSLSRVEGSAVATEERHQSGSDRRDGLGGGCFFDGRSRRCGRRSGGARAPTTRSASRNGAATQSAFRDLGSQRRGGQAGAPRARAPPLGGRARSRRRDIENSRTVSLTVFNFLPRLHPRRFPNTRRNGPGSPPGARDRVSPTRAPPLRLPGAPIAAYEHENSRITLSG